MANPENFIRKKLEERKAAGTYRALKPESSLIDFCSNDYLGFARSEELKQRIAAEIAACGRMNNGSTGSRLLSGNSDYASETERYIAGLCYCEAGLMFNSGYDANLGLFSALPQKGDTVIMDELIHASIIDGTRLSHAARYRFRHNDPESLEKKLRQAKGNCYIAIESVYSMDGDTPPLADMAALAERYEANLIVDEAHAVGLFGLGLVDAELQNRVFTRVVTFGKALGCHGAIVLGSELLHDYLVNYARPFIYTTAAPHHQVVAVRMAFQHLRQSAPEIEKLKNNIRLFKQNVNKSTGENLITSNSPIQSIRFNDNKKAAAAAKALQGKGLDVRAILSPSVAAGSERIRVCLHSFNTAEEITLLTDTINQITNAG